MSFVMNWIRKMTGVFKSPDDDIPRYTFPDSLEDFGYQFNEKGELVNKDGGGFQFEVRKGDRIYNQQHYDALGEVVTDYLYNLMERELKLERIPVPIDAKREEVFSFIFKSADALEKDKLMVLIHGSGAVRAGQWSRKLIINENIDTGSQLPYIRRAIEDGYGVIVMNPNLNEAVVNGKKQPIRGNSSPKEHGVYVWQHFISQAKAKDIVIVAHSFGGIVTCAIAEKFLKDFEDRVFSVVFTDSVHSADRSLWTQQVKQFMKERAVNFASAYVPQDTMLQASSEDDCLSVSAGTKEHERTSHSCIDSAFKFIRDNYASWITEGKMAPRDFLPLPEDLDKYSPARRWEEMQAGEAASKKQEEKGEEEDKSSKKEEAAKTSGEKEDDELVAKNGAAPETENGVSKTDNAEVKTEDKEVDKKDVKSKVTPDDQQSEVATGGEEAKVSTGDEQSQVVKGDEKAKVSTGDEQSQVAAGDEEAKVSTGDEQSQVVKSDEKAKVSTGDEQSQVAAGDEEAKVSTGDEQSQVVKGDEKAKVSTGDEQSQVVKGDEKAKVSTGDEQSQVAAGDEETKVSTGDEQVKVNTETEQIKASPDDDQDNVSADAEPSKTDTDTEPATKSTADDKGEVSTGSSGVEEGEEVVQAISPGKKELKSEL